MSAEELNEVMRPREQPTLASIVEGRFAGDLAKALRAWRRTGKPYKR